jgi:hypothetical protein
LDVLWHCLDEEEEEEGEEGKSMELIVFVVEKE